MITAVLILCFITIITIFSSDNYIFAQYGGGPQVGSSTLEEELKLAQRMLETSSEIYYDNAEKYYESKQFPLSSYITTTPLKFNDTQIYENKDL